MKRLWKALPEGVRASAHRSSKALLDAITPAMVAVRWRRGGAGGGPVAVAGLYRSVIGLGQGARLFAAALEQGGVPVGRIDVGETIQVRADLTGASSVDADTGAAPGGVLVTHLNPPELKLWLQRTAARPLKGRRHIGYWAWELPQAPPAWREAFGWVDEVWCPSQFTADAIRAAAPAHVPVRVVAHPIHMTPRLPPDGARFALPDGVCIVLMALDLKSTLARKNPIGAIEAYRRAVPVPDGSSLLLCKLTGGRQFPERLAEVERAIGGRPDIRLMAEDLSVLDMTRVIASADIVLSLHRAEGFGLLPAEALWLGKPVVATAWSGVMDFLDEDSAVLIPWTATPVHDPQAMYAGGQWADPDLAAAADRLGALIADPRARAALGAKAAARAQTVFDEQAWLARIRPLLAGP